MKKEDKVPGSGILTAHFSEGASFPVVDAVRLMIAFSDNTATNLVIDKNEDKSWTAENAGNRLCATVAREVFSHFNPAPTKTQ